jgi:hypothetical protein
MAFQTEPVGRFTRNANSTTARAGLMGEKRQRVLVKKKKTRFQS